MPADYTRPLHHRLPLIRGPDVQVLQRRLDDLGFSPNRIDGLYEHSTTAAVREFQSSRDLKVDGLVGPRTWSTLFEGHGAARIARLVPELTTPHAFRDSVTWRLTPEGLLVGDDDTPEVWGGPPATVRRVWSNYGAPIRAWGRDFGVPVELIVSTICTESDGQARATREEPGYVSDAQTPDRVSVGVMQTLISTARSALGEPEIGRDWLLEPANSIRAGTAYIAQQWKETHLDPPKVACAYNAGGIYHNDAPDNRWRMRQYPIGTSKHADRFVKWFNECFLMFDEDGGAPPHGFYAQMSSDEADVEAAGSA
jgi:peptidoglycan hydrolase-like protein with peptidoglycan-binding domain